MTRLLLFIISVVCTVITGPVMAQNLSAVRVTGPLGIVTFDRNQLEAMGLVTVRTSTPWHKGIVKFEGVPITLLLEKANAEGTVATITALNDYSVDIPVSDFTKFGTILAVKRDGEYMPTDDQGPFFVIYPYDSNPVLQGQPYHGRSVWQVKAISVR